MSILQNFAEGLLGSLHPFLQLSRETHRSWFSFFLSLISMFIRYFYFSELMNTFQVLLPHLCQKLACQMSDSCLPLVLLEQLCFPPGCCCYSVTVLLAGAAWGVMSPMALVRGWCCLIRWLPATRGVLAGHQLSDMSLLCVRSREIGHISRTQMY